ncbi:MAG TPA: exodeoxyribonuclease V subunit alpha [Acidimicrobiales bacterium]|nr:exodeoxyribonuclease V subunit alpha [Acidimicrobiales bacterium]
MTLTDPFDSALVLALADDGVLGEFNRAGVLAPADVHVARRLGRLAAEGDEQVALAAALAVRAPRVGHVHVDLATVRRTADTDADSDVDVDALAWPEPETWVERLAASPLVSVGEDGPDDRPLRLVGTTLYLDRYWRDEGAVAADLLARSAAAPPAVDEVVLGAGLDRLFPGEGAADQRQAAATAVRRRLAVVAGGPGTGKTTTVARVIALLEEQAAAAGARPPLVALAAPTGKAAARMAEAVRAEAERMDVAAPIRARLTGVDASTLHRLLVRHPGNTSRFRHDRRNRLPHDVVVVDETSMVSLGMMACLTQAVRPDARLVLVGDPEQLASVEAGAVLGDIVGPAAATAGEAAADEAPSPFRASVALLRANYRFGGVLADLAGAIRAGDGDGTVALLRSGAPEVRWLPVDVASCGDGELAAVKAEAVATGAEVLEAARAGDGSGALQALGRFRLLCAHRRGPAGVATWNPRVEEWLGAEVDGFGSDGAWYAGRPVIVTANDYSLRLYNGDTGVVVARPGGWAGVAFDRGGAVGLVSPSRLAAVDTVFAMTVHKAQGSEFDEVAILLPEPGSRVLTRELLYTGVTRARQRVLVAGTEESVRAAVERPIARASGLTARLWGAGA